MKRGEEGGIPRVWTSGGKSSSSTALLPNKEQFEDQRHKLCHFWLPPLLTNVFLSMDLLLLLTRVKRKTSILRENFAL